MNVVAILVTGHTDGMCDPGWAKAELQKLLDSHAPFIGCHFRVKTVEVTHAYPGEGVRRAQARDG